jgi:hypothetical protein
MNHSMPTRSQKPSKTPGWILLIVVLIAALGGGAVTAYRLHHARPATQPIAMPLRETRKREDRHGCRPMNTDKSESILSHFNNNLCESDFHLWQ